MSDASDGSPQSREERILLEAAARGPLRTLAAYFRLGGPGWVQSAITLGGGSLASCLYLGAISGLGLLWLQPLAMVLGVVMLSAIGFVTLSLDRSPFHALRDHVSPVLAYSWAWGSLAASMIWAMPQFSLATGVIQQNLAPGLLGSDGAFGPVVSKVVIVAGLALATLLWTRTWSNAGGVRWYEAMLKLLVAGIVLAFVGVVARIASLPTGPSLLDVLSGFLPDPRRWFEPAPTYRPLLEAMDVAPRAYWRGHLLGLQRDVLTSAAATAVGINMTFLLPCTLRARGWTSTFRGFLRFDLATGLLLPFTLATSCIVVAAAEGFHGRAVPGLLGDGPPAAAGAQAEFEESLRARIDAVPLSGGAELADVPRPERILAAMLVRRDAFDLARALDPLAGGRWARVLFGVGVLGMALSTITVQMLIAGFVLREVFGGGSAQRSANLQRRGALLVLVGALGPFLWKQASFYLAVPASLFGMTLLPVAYCSFVLLMNSERLLGAQRPRGRSRWIWNLVLIPTAALAIVASLVTLKAQAGWVGYGAAAVFVAAAILVRPSAARGGSVGTGDTRHAL